MRLLDEPFLYDEKRNMLDTLEGSIARMCASDDLEEIVCQLGFAVDSLNMLAYSRVMELQRRTDR